MSEAKLVSSSNSAVVWHVTAPNPRHPGTGYDAGQRGWRLHAVNKEKLRLEAERIKADPLRLKSGAPRVRSLCGIRPSHGWGNDFYIEEECSRCAAILEKLGACEKCRGEGTVVSVVQKPGAPEGVGMHDTIPCGACAGTGYRQSNGLKGSA